jgi:hypothetical protein
MRRQLVVLRSTDDAVATLAGTTAAFTVPITDMPSGHWAKCVAFVDAGGMGLEVQRIIEPEWDTVAWTPGVALGPTFRAMAAFVTPAGQASTEEAMMSGTIPPTMVAWYQHQPQHQPQPQLGYGQYPAADVRCAVIMPVPAAKVNALVCDPGAPGVVYVILDSDPPRPVAAMAHAWSALAAGKGDDPRAWGDPAADVASDVTGIALALVGIPVLGRVVLTGANVRDDAPGQGPLAFTVIHVQLWNTLKELAPPPPGSVYLCAGRPSGPAFLAAALTAGFAVSAGGPGVQITYDGVRDEFMATFLGGAGYAARLEGALASYCGVANHTVSSVAALTPTRVVQPRSRDWDAYVTLASGSPTTADALATIVSAGFQTCSWPAWQLVITMAGGTPLPAVAFPAGTWTPPLAAAVFTDVLQAWHAAAPGDRPLLECQAVPGGTGAPGRPLAAGVGVAGGLTHGPSPCSYGGSSLFRGGGAASCTPVARPGSQYRWTFAFCTADASPVMWSADFTAVPPGVLDLLGFEATTTAWGSCASSTATPLAPAVVWNGCTIAPPPGQVHVVAVESDTGRRLQLRSRPYGPFAAVSATASGSGQPVVARVAPTTPGATVPYAAPGTVVMVSYTVLDQQYSGPGTVIDMDYWEPADAVVTVLVWDPSARPDLPEGVAVTVTPLTCWPISLYGGGIQVPTAIVPETLGTAVATATCTLPAAVLTLPNPVTLCPSRQFDVFLALGTGASAWKGEVFEPAGALGTVGKSMFAVTVRTVCHVRSELVGLGDAGMPFSVARVEFRTPWGKLLATHGKPVCLVVQLGMVNVGDTRFAGASVAAPLPGYPIPSTIGSVVPCSPY